MLNNSEYTYNQSKMVCLIIKTKQSIQINLAIREKAVSHLLKP